MAEQVYRLRLLTDRPLGTIVESISGQLGANLVDVVGYQLGESEVLLAVFEHFYFRVKSFVSVSLLLTAHAGDVRADVIASGGGDGLLNISWGANGHLAKRVVDLLIQEGFNSLS